MEEISVSLSYQVTLWEQVSKCSYKVDGRRSVQDDWELW